MQLTRGRSFVNSSEELLNEMSVFVSFIYIEIRQSVPSKHIKLTSKMPFHYPEGVMMLGLETVFDGFQNLPYPNPIMHRSRGGVRGSGPP